MKLKAVLFDLDGVLIDTEDIYTEFWSGIDRQYPTGIENFAYVIKGTTLKTILDEHFDKKNHPEICQKLRDFEDNMPYRLFDGVIELLSTLRQNGVSTAIVTSSNRLKMSRVFNKLPELEALIDTLVTDEDVTVSKPDPQGYLLAAKRLKALPDSFAVVEDSLHGLEAGRRAGGKVVGITTTNTADLVKPLCDYMTDSVENISSYLLSDF